MRSYQLLSESRISGVFQPEGPSLPVFPPGSCMPLCFTLNMPPVSVVLLSLIFLPHWCLVRSTHSDSRHYSFLSVILLLWPSCRNTFLSMLFSNIFSLYFPLNVRVKQAKFIHFAVRLTTDPKCLPKPVFHTVGSSAFSFNYQYSLVSLRLFSSCLHLLHLLLVTSIPFTIFPSVLSSKRLPTQHVTNPNGPSSFIVCRIFLSSLTLCNTFSFLTIGPNYLAPSPAPHFRTFQIFLIYFLKCPNFSTSQRSAANVALL